MSRRRSSRLAQLQSYPPSLSTITTRRSRNGEPAVRLRFGDREDVRNPSCPDSRQVGARREREETNGGPSAPLPTSFIDIVDTTVHAEEDAEVFHADRFVNILTSHVRSLAMSQTQGSEDQADNENVEIEVETCIPCLSTCIRINGQCPTCRRRLPLHGFHPIYLFQFDCKLTTRSFKVQS